MEFRFDVWELEDALIAQAAVNAAVVEMQRQQAAKKEAAQDVGCTCNTDVVYPTLEELLPTAVAQVSFKEAKTALDVQFSKEKVKEAAKQNPELAALVSKKGRKTADEQARIQELTAQALGETLQTDLVEYLETAEMRTVGVSPVLGAEFAGATAEQLQAILEATTDEVSSTDTVQVRTLPSFLSDVEVTDEPVAEEPAADEPEVTNSFEDLTDADLYTQITDAAEGGRGFMWFKNVVDQGGGVMGKLPREHMIAVLTNPENYYGP